jgi:hypothetical protein
MKNAYTPKLVLDTTKKKVLNLSGTPITMKIYCFKLGRTIHVANQEITTMVMKKTFRRKKCHVHLPADKRRAGSYTRQSWDVKRVRLVNATYDMWNTML